MIVGPNAISEADVFKVIDAVYTEDLPRLKKQRKQHQTNDEPQDHHHDDELDASECLRFVSRRRFHVSLKSR